MHSAEALPSDTAATVLQAATEAVKPVARALYELLLREHPGANVFAWPKQRIVSFGHGPKKMSQHYAYIGLQARHVNLGFYMGATLPDPTSALLGTGKNLRHVKVCAVSEVRSQAVLSLVRAAIQERLGHGTTAA